MDTNYSDETFLCGDGTCNSEDFAVAWCPSGEMPIAGGFFEDMNLDQFANTVLGNAPVTDGNGDFGWGVLMADIDETDGGVFAYATCAALPESGAAKVRHSAIAVSRLRALAANGLHAR
jgi:hypothetical protein